MILIDTSAWVEFLRDTGSAVCVRVDDLLDDAIATCDPIRMECSQAPATKATSITFAVFSHVRRRSPSSRPIYEMAAALYRGCRRRGETARKLIDCLIAAVAIRADIPVLHADSDFQVLARHTALRVDEG